MVKGPEKPLSQLYQRRNELNAKLEDINAELDTMAATCIPLLEEFARRLSSEMEYEIVVSNTLSEADDKLKILEGFAPVEAAKEVEKFCNDHEIFFLKTDPRRKKEYPSSCETETSPGSLNLSVDCFHCLNTQSWILPPSSLLSL